MNVEAGGELTFERVQMEGGNVTFAGVVFVVESSLAEVVVTGSSGSALSISDGTVTASTLSVTSGRTTVDAGCVLTDSPISVSGSGGSVLISGAELQSDGSFVPLAVESNGVGIVTHAVFRSTAGDITAVSVAEDGSLTVGDSQLISADGIVDPFPCDGTLPDCSGEHDGSVVVHGPSAINMAAPLVCDVETGECLAETHFVGSAILTMDMVHWLVLQLPDDYTSMERCFYSVSDDISSPSVFHQRCDQFDRTVVIAQNLIGANRRTFGGFAAASWSKGRCCENSVNQCLGHSCIVHAASADFLFALGPNNPVRFDPTNAVVYTDGRTDDYYQELRDWWPNWGRGADLALGQDQALGVGATCMQGHTYGGTPDQICGSYNYDSSCSPSPGRSCKHWEEIIMEVWALI
eukprot:SAG22_NODE_468_length_10147_cov_77.238654_8_plen_407_part_00